MNSPKAFKAFPVSAPIPCIVLAEIVEESADDSEAKETTELSKDKDECELEQERRPSMTKRRIAARL
jgi:hypothetical protein